MDGQSPSTVPIAIAIAFVGALIAFSLYVALKPATTDTSTYRGEDITVPEVTDADHIVGNPNAPVKIIEYSDLDCPYCRTFHATMKQIMAVYGARGEVAWVYRHFPIVELHPNAPKLAEASECVAELGGNEAFWNFIDGVFTSPNYNDRFNMAEIDVIAAAAGSPADGFRECIESGRYKEKVAEQFEQAKESGGKGTPHNIVLGPDGETIPLSGSRAYATIAEVIEALVPR